MRRLLTSATEFAYVLLRVFSGLMFAVHGAQKLFGVFGGNQRPFGTQLWIGGAIELVAGMAVALGLFTPWAALLASGTMAVAYVQFHWKLQGGEMLLPAVNKGEPALLFCLIFFYIACRGSGGFALGGRMKRAG